jgi:hypothetical protein
MGAVGGARCRGATLKRGRVAAGGGGADASRPAPSDRVPHRGAVRAKWTRGVCRLQAAAAAEAAALRSKVEGWGLSAAGVRAVCAARPPLRRDRLLALGGERARLEAALGAPLILADWKAVDRGVRDARALHRWWWWWGPFTAMYCASKIGRTV